MQLAQKLYDESEDHCSELKISNDTEAIELFSNVAKEFSAVDLNNMNEITNLAKEITEKAKNTNSDYLKNLLSAVN